MTDRRSHPARWVPRRVPRMLALPCVLAALVAGCAPVPDASAPPDKGTASDPRELEVAGVPAGQPGLTTLTSVSATRGDASLPAVKARAGDLWVTMLCTGGSLEVRIDPIASLPVTCPASGVTPFLHQVTLSSAQDISIRVSGAAGVLWNMRIEQ